MDGPEAVLAFWFGEIDSAGLPAEERRRRWFRGEPAFDDEVRERFAADVEAALAGERDAWAAMPRGQLGLILLLDQFTRNLYRDTARMYAGDARAQALAREAVETGQDRGLEPIERYFIYMPLMHAEDRALQRLSVSCFRGLLKAANPKTRATLEGGLEYAQHHSGVVERFGRFPHRNLIFGRDSTADEREFLEKAG